MAIELNFLTEDNQEIQACKDYWRLDDGGNGFVFTAREVATTHDLKYNGLARQLNECTLEPWQALREFEVNTTSGQWLPRTSRFEKSACGSFSGPCPKCGGDDRFHINQERFMCRSCHPDWGDVIEYVSWMKEMDFLPAVEYLGASEYPTGTYEEVPAINNRV